MKILLLLMVLLGPLAVMPWSNEPFTIAKDLFLALAISLLVSVHLLACRGRAPFRLASNPLWGWVMLFYGCAAFSIVGAINPYEGFMELFKLTLLAGLSLTVAALPTDTRFVRFLLWASLVPLVWVSLTAILEYYGKISVWGHQIVPYAKQGRIIAYFEHQNNVAQYLIALIPWVAALYLLSRKRWQKAVLALSFCVILPALYVTFCRGGWIGIGVALGCFALLGKRYLPQISWRWAWGMVTAIGIGGVVAVEATAPRASTVQTTTQEKRGELVSARDSERLQIWKDSIEMWRTQPWLGVGLGNWWIAFPKYHDYKNNFRKWAENDYVHLLAETGLLGGASLLGLILVFCRTAYRYVREEPDREYRVILVGLFSSIVATLVHTVFSYNLHMAFPAFLLSLSAGLIVSIGTRRERTDPAPAVMGRFPRGLYVGASLALPLLVCVAVFCQVMADFHFSKAVRVMVGGHPEQARAEAAKALEFHPNRPDYHHALGIWQMWDVPDQALYHLGRAAELTPYSNANRLVLASACAQRGDMDLVIGHLETYLEIDPGKHFVRNELGNLYAQKERWPEAEDQYRTILEDEPSWAGAHYNLALLLERQERYRESLIEYHQVTHYLPHGLAGRHGKARMLERIGWHREAVEEYEACLKWNPQDAAAYKNMGLIYLERLGERSKGIGCLRTSLEFDPFQREADRIVQFLQREGT
jgi:O-antigen ligase/Flp pilus assembly protein TadD